MDVVTAFGYGPVFDGDGLCQELRRVPSDDWSAVFSAEDFWRDEKVDPIDDIGLDCASCQFPATFDHQ